jgi:hypothetical protein
VQLEVKAALVELQVLAVKTVVVAVVQMVVQQVLLLEEVV